MKKTVFGLVLLCAFASANEMLAELEKNCKAGDMLSCDELGGAYDVYHSFYQTNRDYKKAFKFYEKACKGKVYNSCYQIAVLYQFGQGVEKNLKKSIDYHKIACDDGRLVGSCQIVGKMYAGGIGVEQDVARGEAYMKKSCDIGSWMACGVFGGYYEDAGKSKQAARYYQRACDMGVADPDVQNNAANKNIWRGYCDKVDILK